MPVDRVALEIVESIYDAATDPSLWPAALGRLAAPSRGQAFLAFRDKRLPAERWPVHFAGMAPEWVDAFHRHYASRVPWVVSRFPRRAPGTAVPSEAVIRRPDLVKTEFYSDFLRPQGLISGIGVTLMRGEGRMVSTGVYVPLEAEKDQAAHVALVQRVAPHIERALKVNRQLSGADFRWQAAEQCLDRLAVGVVLLSADRTVQFANSEAERMLAEQDGLRRDRDGRLRAAAPADDARLQAEVRSVATMRSGTPGDRSGVLAMRRISGRRPYGVLLAATRPPAGLFGPAEPGAMVFIGEGRLRQPSREQLASTFGLTLAESRLLQVLLQGHGLTEAADRLGNSVNTAKTHLRALFEKLDCSRQADLIHAVTSHPVWLAGQGGDRS